MMSEICSAERSSVQYFAQVEPEVIEPKGMASRGSRIVDRISILQIQPRKEK
jgi:hypothetical protein